MLLLSAMPKKKKDTIDLHVTISHFTWSFSNLNPACLGQLGPLNESKFKLHFNMPPTILLKQPVF